jgi:hypothetical protein
MDQVVISMQNPLRQGTMQANKPPEGQMLCQPAQPGRQAGNCCGSLLLQAKRIPMFSQSSPDKEFEVTSLLSAVAGLAAIANSASRHSRAALPTMLCV